ncbi:unnamed protein product, partial [marine sediment metagenome]
AGLFGTILLIAFFVILMGAFSRLQAARAFTASSFITATLAFLFLFIKDEITGRTLVHPLLPWLFIIATTVGYIYMVSKEEK